VRPTSEVVDIVSIVYLALTSVEIVTSLTELTLLDSSLATAAKRCHQVFVYYQAAHVRDHLFGLKRNLRHLLKLLFIFGVFLNFNKERVRMVYRR
jgi:hypothetical protein